MAEAAAVTASVESERPGSGVAGGGVVKSVGCVVTAGGMVGNGVGVGATVLGAGGVVGGGVVCPGEEEEEEVRVAVLAANLRGGQPCAAVCVWCVSMSVESMCMCSVLHKTTHRGGCPRRHRSLQSGQCTASHYRNNTAQFESNRPPQETQ